MKKKILGMVVSLLLLTITISAGASGKNIDTSGTTPSQSLMSMTKMTTGCLKNNLIPGTKASTYIPSEAVANWKQQAKLLASDGSAGDNFSSLGISLSGDTALIGAWSDDDSGTDSGSAYVFTRTGTTWTEQAKLLASDETGGDAFGWCCAIEGDTALIGAAGDDMLKGSAYVFTRTGTTWTEQTKLIANDGAPGDQFGYSVSLSGDTAVIGANCDDDKGFDSGSAYVFVRTDSTWTQQAKIVAPDGASLDSFGGEVSISGNTALIGSCFDDDLGFDSGSAYVFIRTGTTWTEQAKLHASDGATEDFFSIYAVSISDDTALVGAAGNDDNGEASGSAYVFLRTGTAWTEQAKLLATDGEPGDSFGGAVSIAGETAVIGAGGCDDNGADSGKAYVFVRTNGTWIQEATLLASDGSAGDVFGWDVTINDDTVLVGAEWDEDNGAKSGSVYVFGKENQPPVADFSWNPDDPLNNQPITFDASASYDPDGSIVTFEWDWNNDGVYDENHTAPFATHVWADPGGYPVTVRVTDEQNATGIVTRTVNVNGSICFDIVITGGFGATAVITNNGTVNATRVKWTFTLTGGLILLGKTRTGTVISLAPGASTTVKDIPILGFGRTTLTVDVTCVEGPSNSKAATGAIFLLFVLGM